MPVPNSIDDLSTTEAENSPQGTETAKGTIDNYFRRHASFIAQLRDLIAGLAASAIQFMQNGTGAVSRTLENKLRDTVSAFDFMTPAQISDCRAGTLTLDLSGVLQSAIDATTGFVAIPIGKYRLGSQIIVRGNCSGLIGECEYSSTLVKQFNGEAVSCLTHGAILRGFGIEGNGATFTGGGILPEGYNTLITKVRITDTADSPIIVKAAIGSSSNAATYLTVLDCFLNPTDLLTAHSVRSIGNDDPGRPTCRTFSKLTGGASLVDFSGMNYATLTDSLGTSVKFSANSGKIHMSGCRITAQGNITLLGVDHVITENSWGFGSGSKLYIDATAANVTFDASNAISYDGSFGGTPVIGHAIGGGMPCYISTGAISYPFQWYGTTTNPVLGNANVSAYYKLSDNACWASLSLLVGSTTSVGAGVYTFQLPFKALVGAVGAALVRASDGTYYPATFIVQGGGAVGLLYIVAGSTAPLGSTTLSLGAGASVSITVDYLVATA